jgi:WD repeat-containing protein 60
MLSNPFKPSLSKPIISAISDKEYDDDFEVELINKNYEDDFEDVDAYENHNRLEKPKYSIRDTGKCEKGLTDLFSAESVENSKPIQLEQQKSRFKTNQPQQTTELPPRKLQVTKSQVSKRHEALRGLLQLDFCIYDLFDMPILNEFELYMRSYGSGMFSHQQSQSNEDVVLTSQQTEDWDVCDRWTQCPPHNLVEVAEANSILTGKPKKAKQKLKEAEFDPVLLNKFLEKSTKLIEILLMEKEIQQDEIIEDDTLAFKNQCDLSVPDFIQGKVFSVCKLDQTSSLAAWILDTPIRGAKSALILYNVSEVQPKKIMMCFPTLSVISTHESCPNLVFGGTTDGSVQVWDLNEPDRNHKIYNGFYLRFPTVITDSLLALASSHSNAIVSIKVNATKVKEHTQIVSIDQDGRAQTWV